MSSGYDTASDSVKEEDADATSERVTEAIDDGLEALERDETVSKEAIRDLLDS